MYVYGLYDIVYTCVTQAVYRTSIATVPPPFLHCSINIVLFLNLFLSHLNSLLPLVTARYPPPPPAPRR